MQSERTEEAASLLAWARSLPTHRLEYDRWLGQTPEAVVSIPVQKLLEIQVCTHGFCPNEAVPGTDRCSIHKHDADPLSRHTTDCTVTGCGWTYTGTQLRGASFLESHMRIAHPAQAEVHAPRDDEPYAEPPAPEPPSKPKEKTVPKTKKIIDTDRTAALWAFRNFHKEYGRWPLPIDAKEIGGLPTRVHVDNHCGGWQSLWDELGAGKLPMGRAAGTYRSQTVPPGAVEVESEPEPVTTVTETVRVEVVDAFVPSFAQAAAALEAASRVFDEAERDYRAALDTFNEAARDMGLEVTTR